MSDDNKNIFDEIEEIIFSDEFEQEIEKSLSENNVVDDFVELKAGSGEQLPEEKTIVKDAPLADSVSEGETDWSGLGSELNDNATPNVQDVSADTVVALDLDETQNALDVENVLGEQSVDVVSSELEIDFSGGVSAATEMEKGEHDVDAFVLPEGSLEDGLVDVSPGETSISMTENIAAHPPDQSIDFGSELDALDDISGSSEGPTQDVSHAAKDTPSDIDNPLPQDNADNSIQGLFMDVEEEPVRASTELETGEGFIEDVTEFVESEDISNSISAEVDQNAGIAEEPTRAVSEVSMEGGPDDAAGEDALAAVDPTGSEQWPEKKKAKIGSLGKLSLMIGGPLIFAGLAGMLLFTESGLFGISFKRNTADGTASTASGETKKQVKMTSKLLGELDQKYTQALKLFEDDTYLSYQQAKGLFEEIIDVFPDYEHASSGLASALLLSGHGVLDTQQKKDVQEKLKQADQVSANTAETLRAKIRYLLSENKTKEAQARVSQLIKIPNQSQAWQSDLVIAEFYIDTQAYDQAKQYIDQALSKSGNLTRATYLKAGIHALKGEPQKAINIYQGLAQKKGHVPSSMAVLKQKQLLKEDIQLELETMLTEKSKEMSPFVYAKGYRLLSDIFASEGKEAKSIQMLKLAVKKTTLNAQDTHMLGLKLKKVLKHDEALDYFKQAHLLAPDHANYRVSYAKALRRDRRPSQAQGILESIVGLDPLVEEAVTEYAEAQADMGRYDEAIAYLAGVLDKQATLAGVPVVLGTLYLEQNKLDQAKSTLEIAEKNATSNQEKSNVMRAMAMVDIKQERFAKAISRLKRSDEIGPQNPKTLFALGEASHLNKNLAEAERFIVAALNIDHTFDQAREKLAEIYFDSGKKSEAETLINEVLDVDPKNIDMLLAKGKILFKEKKYSKAFEAFDSVYLLDPENFDVQYYLGMTSREMGKFDDAFRFFKRALEIWPGSSLGHYQRGLTHLANEDVDNGTADMEAAIKQKPSWSQPKKSLARYHYNQGVYKQAVNIYEDVVKQFPSDKNAKLYLAKSYFAQQRAEDALKIFDELVKGSPTNSEYHFELGVVYEDIGAFKKALPSLQRAQRLDSSNPDIVYHLGFVLKNLSRRKEAAQMFEKYLKMKPDSVEKKALEDEIFRLKNHS